VPAISDEAELLAILESRLANSAMRATIGHHLLTFWRTFVAAAPPAARGGLSVRDLLAWVGFINTTEPQLGALQAYAHGAYLTLLDGLGLGLGIPAVLLEPLKGRCRQLLLQQLSTAPQLTQAAARQGLSQQQQQQQQQQQCLSPVEAAAAVAQASGELLLSHPAGQGPPPAAADSLPSQPHTSISQAGISNSSSLVNSSSSQASESVDVRTADGRWGIPPFFVVRGPQGGSGLRPGPRFNFQAPTTCRNAFRLLRALQVRQPLGRGGGESHSSILMHSKHSRYKSATGMGRFSRENVL